MFSHIVVFWTDPASPNAADELLAGANQLLKQIPDVLHFHAGKMTPSRRPVVEQGYQIALNLIFQDRKSEQDYQAHPRHLEFVEKYVKRLMKKAGRTVMAVPFFKRREYNATKIREMMRVRGKWQQRVPKKVRAFLKKAGIAKRLQKM